jgi:hypothetical protein
MSKTIKKISLPMAILAIFGLFSPMPSAQAITAQEALRLLGVLGRYADDLHRTFPNGIGQPYNPYQPPTQPSTGPFNPQMPAEFQQP